MDGPLRRALRRRPRRRADLPRRRRAARHAAVNPVVEDASGWSTGARMRRYLVEALPLGKEAVAAALADAGLAAEDIGLFAVASCTGYATPGLDIRIAADLGMAPDLQRLARRAHGLLRRGPRPGRGHRLRRQPPPAGRAAVLRADVAARPAADRRPRAGGRRTRCSATPPRPSWSPRTHRTASGSGLEVLDVAALTDAGTADHMTWDVTDLGFRMGLSAEVPAVLARHVRGHVTDAAGPARVHRRRRRRAGPCTPADPASSTRWSSSSACRPRPSTRRGRCWPTHGNCSSTTVLLVLDALRSCGRPRAGRPAVVTAFGPGLTLYTALLRG